MGGQEAEGGEQEHHDLKWSRKRREGLAVHVVVICDMVELVDEGPGVGPAEEQVQLLGPISAEASDQLHITPHIPAFLIMQLHLQFPCGRALTLLYLHL